ncbi:AIPR family protein [Vibrio jasicida]|uniref:AIPR family protein n=1 Tax=Vibrio jasicida TaxID=766224 RepID=UPI00163E330E|nr:AIPR family protein [Vibrio jasicida]
MADIFSEFNQQLIADVQTDADALGLVTVEAFFEKTGELLVEAGEVESVNRSYFEGSDSRYTVQVDGYGGDPRENGNVLTLIICDLKLGADVLPLHKSDIQKLSLRLLRYLHAGFKSKFTSQIEETSSGYVLTDLIRNTWRYVDKVKLIIVTNRLCRSKIDSDSFEEFDGRPVTLSVWDIQRLQKFIEQGQTRASTVIDFKNDFGGGIPLLPASGTDKSLESYLAVMPGKQLAEIYDKWGPRLLESNVRSFLQARGSVNKGIRNTIRDEPHMFFPYNNGLSATVEEISTELTSIGLLMVTANNFQIVNGGQTTASLHAALKAYPEQLSHVYVQLKITIAPKKYSEEVVPKISEFANSQNKVNAADFFSNHPFHICIEELSRRILAPSGLNNYRETKWFYERARGQFADERGRRTIAERKKFDAEFPRSQFFTKTDLAKYEKSWSCEPYLVSLGAQKNFSAFAKDISKKWSQDNKAFNDLWFKRLISKAILFRATERLVSNADWYEGGYRANIVTYAISKVVSDASDAGKVIDLDTIWRSQIVPGELKVALLEAGELAQRVITNPPEGIRNLSEWAKKPMCWQWLKEKKVTYSANEGKYLISVESSKFVEKEQKKKDAFELGINAEIEVFNLGAEFWQQAKNWARERNILSPREVSILEVCASMPRKIPSNAQSTSALKSLEKLKSEGFISMSKL